MSSIWNRIGDVAPTVAKDATKFGGEVLNSAQGIANFAWDVFSAPWNDAEEYNGFSNTIKSAVNKNQKNIVHPLDDPGRGHVSFLLKVRHAVAGIEFQPAAAAPARTHLSAGTWACRLRLLRP